MDREHQRAYQRGYNAGMNHKWPPHKPPTPPDPIVADLMKAAVLLRNQYDALIATTDWGSDDEMERKLGPGIDALDEAMRKVTLWLAEVE